MAGIFYWTGVVVWGAMCIAALLVIWTLAYNAAIVFSHVRWSWRECRRRGYTGSSYELMREAVWVFRRRYVDFLKNGYGEYRTTGNGYWTGIGKWELSEKVEPKQ